MKQNCCTIKYRSLTYIYLIRSVYVSHRSIIPTMMFIHQIILKILSKITRPWNIGHVDIYSLRSKFGSHCLIIWKYITWTYIYFAVKCRVILTHNPKYDVHTWNSLQDVTQNHWTMTYRSQWPTFILRSNIGSYWFILPKNDVHWTVEYRSCWPSLHDAQVHVTRLSYVWQLSALVVSITEKVEKHVLKVY